MNTHVGVYVRLFVLRTWTVAITVCHSTCKSQYQVASVAPSPLRSIPWCVSYTLRSIPWCVSYITHKPIVSGLKKLVGITPMATAPLSCACCACACTHTHSTLRTHTYTHARTAHAHTCTHIHTHTHTHIHTYIHTHIHTYIHTYIHTHIHTYTQQKVCDTTSLSNYVSDGITNQFTCVLQILSSNMYNHLQPTRCQSRPLRVS